MLRCARLTHAVLVWLWHIVVFLCFFLLLYTVCAELTGILAQSPVNTLWYRAVLSGVLLVYVLLIKLADHDTGAGAYPSLGTRSLLWSFKLLQMIQMFSWHRTKCYRKISHQYIFLYLISLAGMQCTGNALQYYSAIFTHSDSQFHLSYLPPESRRTIDPHYLKET